MHKFNWFITVLKVVTLAVKPIVFTTFEYIILLRCPIHVLLYTFKLLLHAYLKQALKTGSIEAGLETLLMWIRVRFPYKQRVTNDWQVIDSLFLYNLNIHVMKDIIIDLFCHSSTIRNNAFLCLSLSCSQFLVNNRTDKMFRNKK